MAINDVLALATRNMPALPAIVASHGEQAAWRYIEFFVVSISNPNTRATYARAGDGAGGCLPDDPAAGGGGRYGDMDRLSFVAG